MSVALLFVIVGSVVGVGRLAWWQTLPSFATISRVASGTGRAHWR